MDEKDDLAKELKKRCTELENKAEYYQGIAEKAGQKRLREVEQLNRLISDHKKSEKALRESEQHFRLIAQSTNDIFYEWDIESGELNWFGEIDIVLGYEAGEIQHTLEDWLRLIHPEDRPLLDDAVLLHKESTKPIDYIYRVMCKDGSIRFWNDIGSPILDQEGKPKKWIGGISDITERKRSEEFLRQKTIMEAVGSLAGGIAHDFKNILAGILGYTELLQMDLSSSNFSPKRIESRLDKILTAGNRAKELTSQLLGFSRQGQYSPKNIDPNLIVSEAYGLVERLANVEGQQLSFSGNAASYIYADQTQFYQVIQNIMINAIYAGSIGNKVSVTTEDVAVKKLISTTMGNIPEGQYVKLTINDNGTGIEEKVLPRIFEPFFTTKEKGKGTGMGLAMVYGIVKNHNGYISVETDTSPENHGTTFSVYFPAVEKREIEKNEYNGNITGTGKILIIDDELSIREMVQDALEMKGYEVVTAAEGQEGLEKFRSGSFDVVITDLIMPLGMDGIELCREVRELDPNVPIYAMSGYHQDKSVQQMLSKGATGFIGKPFKLEELYQIISSALALK